MTRTRIFQDGGSVILQYNDQMTGDRITRTFYAPACGGYVRDDHHRQTCIGLAMSGPTLYIKNAADLLPTIRKHWKAARRAMTA